MIKIEKKELNIYHIVIGSPRQDEDEKVFLKLLKSLSEEKKFGLILAVEGEKNFSLESKKQLNLWFKSNKHHISTSCFGFARVSTEKKRSLALALPCPYEEVQNEEEAMAWIRPKAATAIMKHFS